MQTSLAALYEEEWLLYRTDEGGERKNRQRAEEREGSGHAGEKKK